VNASQIGGGRRGEWALATSDRIGRGRRGCADFGEDYIGARVAKSRYVRGGSYIIGARRRGSRGIRVGYKGE
jgi:hypothetical protein